MSSSGIISKLLLLHQFISMENSRYIFSYCLLRGRSTLIIDSLKEGKFEQMSKKSGSEEFPLCVALVARTFESLAFLICADPWWEQFLVPGEGFRNRIQCIWQKQEENCLYETQTHLNLLFFHDSLPVEMHNLFTSLFLCVKFLYISINFSI